MALSDLLYRNSAFAPCGPGLRRVGIDCVPEESLSWLDRQIARDPGPLPQLPPAELPPAPDATTKTKGPGDPPTLPPPPSLPPPTRPRDEIVPYHPEPTMPPQIPMFAQPFYNPLTAGEIATGVSGADPCQFVPASARAACRAALAGVTTILNRGGGGSTALTPSCPEGWTWSSTLGRCVNPTAALPGGQPLTLTRNEPRAGGLGMTAVTPIQVGTIMRNDGTTGPILRCPKRYVLGQDYLCYPKSMIPNQLRAHPRGTRPLLTGGEVKILRRAKGLEKKVSKLGRQFGTRKPCSCSTRSKKKK